ncbi:MAG: DUF885 domain-containing protein [Lachnospiraceae bacterium]|nr:DUF885 domain-containing protein [Lachnospiraceae bacterium]
MLTTVVSLFNKSKDSYPTSDAPWNSYIKQLPWKRTLCSTFIISVLIFITTFFLLPDNPSNYRETLLTEMKQADTFEEFSKALFCYEVTTDSVTTAYTLKSPSAYDIPTLPPDLTSFSYDTYLTEAENVTSDSSAIIQRQIKILSKTQLEPKEQLALSCLKDYTSTSLSLSQYPFYEYLLGNSSGIQTNLPVTLGEYPLRNQEDVETYLSLLTQIPSYFQDVISYESHRQKMDYETPDFITFLSYNATKSITEGLEKDNNSFCETFNQRVDAITSLTQTEKNTYKQKNQQLVKQHVIPAYNDLLSFLEQQFENNSDNILQYMKEDTPYGICTLPNGKDYYTHLARYSTGSSKSIEQMIAMTDTSLKNALSTVLNTALTDPDAYVYYCEHPLETYYENPESILENLSLMMREQYPSLSKSPSYKVKTVSESLSEHLSPAFYMIPAIDDYQNNTIYINPLYTNEENGNLFPTLAHEGFPGHLYQTVYFNESNPPEIRQVLNYLGYVEGWATYVEMNSLSFLEYPLEGDSLSKLYQAETIINLAISSRIDFGVNYEGWTLNDTRAFFEEQGFNSYYAQDLYAYVVESPTTYLSYFIGYLEIMDIKDAYQRQELENYSEKEFHKRLLDVGPANFDTVRQYVLKP